MTMLTEPKIVTRAAQPFAAVTLVLTQPEIAAKAPPLIADVIAWLKARGMVHTGPPFFNYVAFRPGGKMEMQVGMPTATVVEGDATITTGTLPAGRYAAVTHTGPYQDLRDANMALDAWVRAEGLTYAGRPLGGSFIDATRLEIYHKDPDEDPSGHPVTEVAFLLVD